jgi:hypothetical protein
MKRNNLSPDIQPKTKKSLGLKISDFFENF